MELLLNLVWLVVACTALARWTRQRACGDAAGRRRAWGLELFALGCALVLLFPIISVSDDLQAEPAAVEANRGARPTVKSGDDQSPTANAKPLPAVPGTGVEWVVGRDRFLYRIDDCTPVVQSPQFAWCLALRAPPLPHTL